MIRSDIWSLDALPWPAGLGKTEYPELRDELKQLLGNRYHDPAAHERAFATSPAYRECVDRWLSTTDWNHTLVANVQEATNAALGMELVGQAVDTATWVKFAAEYCRAAGMPYDLRMRGGLYTAGDYLLNPMLITADGQIVEGRHRMAYLRLRSAERAVGPVLIQVCE